MAAPAPRTGGPGAPGAPRCSGRATGWSATGACTRCTRRAPAPEQRLFFADYRDVDGLKLPFRIRRAAGAETTEETTFDRYRINAEG